MFVGMLILLIGTYRAVGGIIAGHAGLTALKEMVPAGLVDIGHRGWTAMPALGSPLWWTIFSTIIMGVGIGVLVNAVLALLTPAFASRNETDLLWGAIAALAVNGPVWWLMWQPNRPDPDTGTKVQRTYLTLLGGVAGLTGAIALIYLVFQLLEGLLEGDSLSGILDDIRAPFGFVAATGLVTAYHYRRWSSSRVHDDKPAPMAVERVTFVGDPSIGAALQSELGVRLTGWLSAGEGRVLSAEELAGHIRDLDTSDVLVVEEDRGYRVVRLSRNHRPQTGEPQE
jgi:hypothetical protein